MKLVGSPRACENYYGTTFWPYDTQHTPSSQNQVLGVTVLPYAVSQAHWGGVVRYRTRNAGHDANGPLGMVINDPDAYHEE